MISFQNDGLIDIRAVTTFGVSSKEIDNPIGFFGTGLKYAISIILRHGGKISIFRGLEEFKFTVVNEKVRNDEFGIIHMNDQPLGFTTRVGATWEPWHAFREIYCNMLDEQGSAAAGKLEMNPDTTTIVVSGFPAFEECYAKRNSIVLNDKPLYNYSTLEVRKGPINAVYYRGILAGELEKPARFAYSIIAPLVLTEDRTIKNQYHAMNIICDAVLQSTDETFIRDFLQADVCYFEHVFDLARTGERPGDTWIKVAADCVMEMERPLNTSVVALLSKWRDVERGLVEVRLSAFEEQRLQRAKALLRLMQYNIDKYEIVIVKSLGPSILGRVMSGKIILSHRAVMMGDNTLFGTLLEEFLHLDHMFMDQTRDFQNYLIDLVSNLAQEVHGHKLRSLTPSGESREATWGDIHHVA